MLREKCIGGKPTLLAHSNSRQLQSKFWNIAPNIIKADDPMPFKRPAKLTMNIAMPPRQGHQRQTPNRLRVGQPSPFIPVGSASAPDRAAAREQW